jgi:transposase InsO family protein
MQSLSRLLRSSTHGSKNTKFLTTPWVRRIQSSGRRTTVPVTPRARPANSRAHLGLLVCTTPTYSPQSNGVAEAFVKTFKRDYVYVNQLPSADEVIAQLPGWFADYIEIHPHKGLGMRSPREYLRAVS